MRVATVEFLPGEVGWGHFTSGNLVVRWGHELVYIEVYSRLKKQLFTF